MEAVKPIIFRPSAREDVRLSGDWLDEQRSGAGNELLGDVMPATRRIDFMPETFPIVFAPDVRRVLIERSDYLMFYRVRPTRVVVLAVIHGRRRPLDIKRRIRDELRSPEDEI